MQHDGIRGQLLTDLIENDGKVTKGWSEVCLTGIQTTCNNSEYDQEIPHSQSPSLQSITNIPAKSKKIGTRLSSKVILKVFVCSKSFHMSHGKYMSTVPV